MDSVCSLTATEQISEKLLINLAAVYLPFTAVWTLSGALEDNGSIYVTGERACNCFFLYNNDGTFDQKKKNNGMSSDF